MAEAGSWDNVQNHGLLSTSSLLDLYGIVGDQRFAIESAHRPECVEISAENLPIATVRDQKPMSDKALARVLLDGLEPQQWYEILNSKVFFWSSKTKVINLLKARAYRHKAHDVVQVNTRQLIDLYKDQIFLCPYNSGCTIMNPVTRGKGFFSRVKDFDFEYWRKKRGRQNAITEVCVEGGVPEIMKIVESVTRMQEDQELEVLYEVSK